MAKYMCSVCGQDIDEKDDLCPQCNGEWDN